MSRRGIAGGALRAQLGRNIGGGVSVGGGEVSPAQPDDIIPIDPLPEPTGYPVTAATGLQANAYTGWTQNPVTVTLTPTDDGGPGIAHTYYTIGTGGQTEYTAPFQISTTGSTLVTYWSVDLDGLAEAVNVGWVNILSASPVPTGLAAVAIGTGTILVSWTPVVSDRPLTYRVYSDGSNPPTTLVLTTGSTTVSIKQDIAVGGRYFAVSSVNAGGSESAKCTAVGPVTAGKIVGTEITENSITSPLIAANTITAGNIAAGTITANEIAAGTITGDQIHANVALSAPVITGGSITGVSITGTSTVTGALIQTGTGAERIVMGEAEYVHEIRFYTPTGGQTPVGRMCGDGLQLYIQPQTELHINGDLIVSGYQQNVGNLGVLGSIKPLANWQSGTSDDGIWIQDSGNVSNREKIYWDSANQRLYIRRDGSAYSYIDSTGLHNFGW